MKLTIINEDNAVYVDGICRIVDLSKCAVPSDIHALQWKGETGWIEFKDADDGSKPMNKTIDILPQWANYAVKAFENAAPAPAPKVEPVTPAPV